MNGKKKRRIVIAGANGFLGRELSRWFLDAGDEVIGLVRRGADVVAGCRRVEWDGHVLGDWGEALEGADALVNLAGRSVNCRYSPGNRAAILESRTASTRILGDAVSLAKDPPAVWLNASTATIYRDAIDEPQDEVEGDLGEGFSVEVALAWEKAFFGMRVPGQVRKVALRTALVLAREDGTVFDYLWTLTRCGLGGSMAGGDQRVSWIHVTDFCRAIHWLVQHDEFEGVVNVTAPGVVTNRTLMTGLRNAARVPFGLPATRWMLTIGAWILGSETELVTKSRWVMPRRLLNHGFRFRWPDLPGALGDLAPHHRQGAAFSRKKTVTAK